MTFDAIAAGHMRVDSQGCRWPACVADVPPQQAAEKVRLLADVKLNERDGCLWRLRPSTQECFSHALLRPRSQRRDVGPKALPDGMLLGGQVGQQLVITDAGQVGVVLPML